VQCGALFELRVTNIGSDSDERVLANPVRRVPHRACVNQTKCDDNRGTRPLVLCASSRPPSSQPPKSQPLVRIG